MGRFTKEQLKQIDNILRRRPSVKPFIGDTPQQKQERKAAVSRRDWRGFSTFCTTYLPHLFSQDFHADHKLMFEEVSKNEHGITIITGYRGLGKTTLMGIAYSLWMICTDQAQYVIHSAALEPKAVKRSRYIWNELMNNARIRWDYPKMEPTDSNYKSYHLANGCMVESATIDRDIRGDINPQTGKRPDLIVYDDIDRSSNRGNARIGRERRDKIKGDGLGALPPQGGRIVVLGNETHKNYAISQFAEEMDPANKRGHIRQDRKSFLRFSVEDKQGKSRWPEQYSAADLANLKRQMGLSTYQREMLGMKVSDGTIFKYEWFKYWVRLPAKYKEVWMYADPSWGEKGCYKAIVIIGLGVDGKYYMIDLWADQCSNILFYERYVQMHMMTMRLKGRSAFETVYGQHKHLKDMDEYCVREGLNPISHWIKRINTKQSKSSRIEALDTVIESGSLLFCKNEYTEDLLSQFLDYPDGYDDIPDAVAGCMERFSGYSKRQVRVRKLVY